MRDKELTDAIKTRWDSCPSCSGFFLTAEEWWWSEDAPPGPVQATCEVTCEECGAHWIEEYSFVGAGSFEKGGQ